MEVDREKLLEELRAAGAVEGRGEFTIDVAAGLEKLGRYQLVERGDYALKLVQSAVAAGATEVEVKSEWGRFELLHDGSCPTLEELTGLLSHVLTPQTNPERRWLRSLAIGANAALYARDATVFVVTMAGGLVITRNNQSLHPDLRPPQGYTTRVSVYRGEEMFHPSSIGSRLLAFLLPPVEGRAVLQHCRWAPVPVMVNRRLANLGQWGATKFEAYRRERSLRVYVYDTKAPLLQQLDLMALSYRHHVAEIRVPPDPFLGRGIGVPVVYEPSHILLRNWDGTRSAALPIQFGPRRGPVFQRCQAVVALCADLSLSSEVIFVKDGVTLRSTLLSSCLPSGMNAVVCVDGLSTDLTEMTLLEETPFVDVGVCVRDFARQLRSWLEAEWPGPSDDDRLAQAVAGRSFRAYKGWLSWF